MGFFITKLRRSACPDRGLIRGVLIPRVSALMDDCGIRCLHVRWQSRDDIDVVRLRMTASDASSGGGLDVRHPVSTRRSIAQFAGINAKKFLYRACVKRVVSTSWLFFDPKRDGATSFETM